MHGKWEYAGFWYLHEPDIKPASARVWLRMANIVDRIESRQMNAESRQQSGDFWGRTGTWKGWRLKANRINNNRLGNCPMLN
jgi:hypothetical protein